MQRNIDVARQIYEAFGRGDVPTILEHLAADVAWESWSNNSAQRAGVSWMQARKGREGVVEFFKAIADLDIRDFNVIALMANENQVAAEIEHTADVRSSGGHFREQEIHLWTFNDHGQVTRFRHYIDTAKHIAAAKGLDTEK
jgi:ketosteroid isomerase-like protein